MEPDSEVCKKRHHDNWIKGLSLIMLEEEDQACRNRSPKNARDWPWLACVHALALTLTVL